MNKSVMAFILLTSVVGACNRPEIQREKVPSVVLNALKASYPIANDVDWKKLGNLYEAELDLNDSIEISTRIDESGKIIMQKKDIPAAELQADVMTTIQNQYKNYVIDDIEKVEKNGMVYYQIELNSRGKRDLNLVFNPDGKQAPGIAYWD